VLAGLVAIAFAVVAMGAAGGDEGHGHGEMPGHDEMHGEAGPSAIAGMD
jgi:hypothetical protein